MKRSLMMLLAGLLVLVMASPLYAEVDIKINGQIRTRLRYWSNFDLDGDIKSGSLVSGSSSTQGMGDRRYWDNRTRLGVDAKLGDSVRAVIQLEKYWDFGNTQPNGANSGPSILATPGDSFQDPYFRQAWMDFPVPGLVKEGIRFQAGRSFFRVGNGFIWGNSLVGEDGFTLYGPLGPGDFKLRYAITSNQSATPGYNGRQRYFDNEINMFAADYKFPVAEKQNIELYFIGQIDREITSYTGTASTAGNLGNIAYATAAGGTVNHGNDYFIGAAYDGVAGPVALKAEFVYGFGPARRNVGFNSSGPCTVGASQTNVSNPAGAGGVNCSSEDNISRSAFFGYAEATYKVIPAWNVGASVTFATGDDDPTDDTFNNFVAPLSEYTATPSRTWVDSEFFMGNQTARGVGNNVTNRFLPVWSRGTQDIDARYSIGDNFTPYSAGLFELNFNTKYTFSKEVSIEGNVVPTWAMNHPDGTGRYLGTELDAMIAYKPFQNIVMNMYGGYFIAGSFFDQGGALLSTSSNVTDSFIFRVESIVTF